MDYHFSIILVLVFISGIANAIMDVFKFKYDLSIFRYLGNTFFWKDSWKNKYKDRDPAKGEAFWGSARWFVFLTNIWHFAQMVWRVSVTSAIIISGYFIIEITSYIIVDIVIVFSVLSLAYLSAFYIFYNWVLRM